MKLESNEKVAENDLIDVTCLYWEVTAEKLRKEDEERYSLQTSQSLRTKTINDPRRLDHARDICETHYNRGAHLHCSAGSVQSANFFQNSNNFLFLHRQLFVLVPSAHDTILLAWWEI